MNIERKKIEILPGLSDVLTKEQWNFEKIERVIMETANFHNFFQISTPILEEEKLFNKDIENNAKITEKQPYSFQVKRGQKLILKPMLMPGMVRAYLENKVVTLLKSTRIWSCGPVFQYEQFQKGEHSQLRQFDFEIFGGDALPATDAFLIQIFSNLLNNLHIVKWKVEVNFLGCEKCHLSYARQLKSYYRSKTKQLCSKCRKKLKKNPLELFSCREEKCQRLQKLAPQVKNILCEHCRLYLKSLHEFLNAMNVSYIFNPYFMQESEYFGKTIFRFISEKFGRKGENSFNVLISGGRYDGLSEKLGYKPLSIIGGSGNLEGILTEIKRKRIKIVESTNNFEEKPKAFLVQLGGITKKKTIEFLKEFKKSELKIGEDIGQDNIKDQIQLATKMGARYLLILGQKECLDETIILRDTKTGIQKILPQKNIIRDIKKQLRK